MVDRERVWFSYRQLPSDSAEAHVTCLMEGLIEKKDRADPPVPAQTFTDLKFSILLS